MKGATKNICNGGYNAGNFNPRSREGSDPRRATHAAHSLAFQFTLP